ncbi:MAG: ubiquinone/menaquinone biosynthesis methyltransferase [Muribaculaceae bacterium]|nr:ubiquinone/menaquinone biosynthesis methyltransferase [Muribaculaceae bacterium]
MQCNKNPEKIRKIFDEISPYYDRMNNIISLGTHYFLNYFVLKNLALGENSFMLDLCCGTGDFTKIASVIAPKTRVIGLDLSEQMIKQAKLKNKDGVFMVGDCTNLPFHDGEFDYVTMGFGLRNIENRAKALDEAYRVLTSGGRFLHLDFGLHNPVSKIFNVIVIFFAGIFCVNSKHYRYLLESKSEFPEPNELIREFEAHGFKYEKRLDYLFGAISAQIMRK